MLPYAPLRPPFPPFWGMLVVGILILVGGIPNTVRAADDRALAGHPGLPPGTPYFFTPDLPAPSFLIGNKLFPLPKNLTRPQQQLALTIITETEPRLIVLHGQLCKTLDDLHNLSFGSDTPSDALPALGRELIRLRSEMLVELQRISGRLEKQAGFNPGWGSRRTGPVHQSANCPLCAQEKARYAREAVGFCE